MADSSDAGDGDAAIFERLAKRLQHVRMELGDLIEKEHSAMREGDLAGVRGIAAADETRHGDRVVRRAKRSRGDQAGARGEKPGDAPDGRDFESLV